MHPQQACICLHGPIHLHNAQLGVVIELHLHHQANVHFHILPKMGMGWLGHTHFRLAINMKMCPTKLQWELYHGDTLWNEKCPDCVGVSAF